MNKGRDLSFFEGKVKVKDLCREQMRILKRFNFKPQKIQSNKNKTTRISLNKRNKQKKTFQVKNVMDEDSPKPQPFIPPVPMDNPNVKEHFDNKNSNFAKDLNKKSDLAFSESPISSIYTDSGQISELANILIPPLKVIQYPVNSVIEKKSVDKNPVNNHPYPRIISNKSTTDKISKYNIKLNKLKPLIVNYSSTASSSSTSIPTTLTSSYNDNIFPPSDTTPPFTPLPQSQQTQKSEEKKSQHHLTTSIPTSISIPSTLTTGKSSSSTTTATTTSSSAIYTKHQSETSSSIPSVLSSSVVNMNQKIGLDTPPPAPELLMNKDLLLPRRLRKVVSPIMEDSESSSSDLSIPIKNEIKSYLGISSTITTTNNNSVSFHPSLLSKTIKPTYSPVSSPNRKRNNKVVIKQSPLSSPYKHLHNFPSPDSTLSSCSLILENNNKNKLIKSNLKIPDDNVSDILVKDIQFIIESSRKSIESMKEDKSLKTIKEENTEEEEERSSINVKQQSCVRMNNVVKKIDFGSSESDDEEEIIGYYPFKQSKPIKEVKLESEISQENEAKLIKETIQQAKPEKETKPINEEIKLDDILLSKLVLPLPSFPIFSETNSQSEETKSTTSSSSMLSKLLNYSPKYMTRDEIEDKYNKVCFKYPPLFLDSDLLDL